MNSAAAGWAARPTIVRAMSQSTWQDDEGIHTSIVQDICYLHEVLQNVGIAVVDCQELSGWYSDFPKEKV